jgi:hypothetical protein
VGSFEGSRIEVENSIGINSLLNSIIAFLASPSIRLERVVDVVDVVHDKGDGTDDDDELEGQCSSELDESIGSINSIAGNTKFVSLY